MFRITFLRSILLYSLAIAALLPLYNALVIFPAYRDVLVRETEDDAVRLVNVLLPKLALESRPLSPASLTPAAKQEIQHLLGDPRLVKLRIFSPEGQIIFSSDFSELGQQPHTPSFFEQVAREQTHSKAVFRDSDTAEGQAAGSDLVETYVPVMAGSRFQGAVETYFDITSVQTRLHELTRQSSFVLLAISTALLLAIIGVLKKAKTSIEKRQKAEESLQIANNDLELRVAERTRQLLEANRQLNAEIAERCRTEKSLIEAFRTSEENKEKIDGILRSVPDGLLVTDHRDRVLLMNDTAEKLLGVSMRQVLGKPVEEVIADPALLEQLGKGAGRQFDFRVGGPGGEGALHYRARTSILVGRDIEVKGMIVLFQDISREQELDRMQNEFLAMTTHELKTPLASIMGYTELLLDNGLFDPTPEQRSEFLGTIYQNAEALARLVDDILDVSRLASGQPMGLDPSPFFMEELLSSAAATYRERYPSHRIELRLPEQPARIVADRGRLLQVLNNLMSNAVKYSPKGSRICLEGESCGAEYRLAVTDQGIGMTAEQVERIFEKFYRADTSDTAVRGTGLGLSITRHILEAHGGRISVESMPSQGTRIAIQLPLNSRESSEVHAFSTWSPISQSA